LVSLIWLVVAFGAWGRAHDLTYRGLSAVPTAAAMEPKETDAVTVISRREFLIRLGGASAVITVAGAGLSALLATRSSSVAATAGAAESTSLAPIPEVGGAFQPAPGTRLELTPVAQHYRIDINSGPPPVIDGSTYKLMIDGLVDSPVALTLDEIRKYEVMDQYVTLSCISNPIAGDLISTTRWTGVSMQDIVNLAKPKPEATYIRISSVDGFYEVVALDLIRQDRRVMLTYAFDGHPLPERNGFPLRIHIPDRYGMKQPKWITHLEFIDSWQPGYWVERTWDKEARVRATSVIDTIAVDQAIQKDGTRLIPMGGVAWAGARGISRVEVKVDDGAWLNAALRPPLSDKTWVIWRYDWPFQPGNHTFTVRCYETDGTPQIETEQDTHPSGATGLHTLSI
jgi:DMSO/TMAO reductase YedYZ molybdopterin-dependent catalytic subunit